MRAKTKTAATYTDERGHEHAACHICGADCSTHPDAGNSLARCGDCGRAACPDHRVEDAATRCNECAATFYATPKAPSAKVQAANLIIAAAEKRASAKRAAKAAAAPKGPSLGELLIRRKQRGERAFRFALNRDDAASQARIQRDARALARLDTQIANKRAAIAEAVAALPSADEATKRAADRAIFGRETSEPICRRCELPGSECACEPCGDFA
jgi:hypothetical protein